MVELSKIERVELREVWPDEAADFTPWLAEEENLSLLGEAIGLDLELREQESSVGSFSLDVLANDQSSGRPVIIENQLTETDHTHLGQILTYAAGHDAGAIVWISKKFRDEHRAALDYLNGRTGEDTEFFGVVVELWKIDDSLPAVKFDLVATPNEWRKESVSKTRGGGTSERSERYRAFLQTLVDTLREEHEFTNAKKASAASWKSFSAGPGLSGVTYNVSFAKGGKVRVEVYIDHTDGKEWNEGLFDQLEERRESIESALGGGSLSWERLDGSDGGKPKKACHISTLRDGTIDDEHMLDDIRKWMIDRLLAFKRVFGPELDKLVPKMDELAE